MADPKQQAQQSIDAFNRGALDDWMKTVAEDVELVTPMGGTIKGRDAFKGYFAQMRTTFPDARVDLKTIVAEGNTVVTEYFDRHAPGCDAAFHGSNVDTTVEPVIASARHVLEGKFAQLPNDDHLMAIRRRQ